MDFGKLLLPNDSFSKSHKSHVGLGSFRWLWGRASIWTASSTLRGLRPDLGHVQLQGMFFD